MFTGIIEELGKVRSVTDKQLVIEAEKVLKGTKIGDSIAVNGVCLTVTKINNNNFEADISQETFRVTALNKLKNGCFVNLERAMGVNGRFGGHIVSGHIDGIGRIDSINKMGEFYSFKIELNKEQEKYVIKKGSISINGISLTIANIKNSTIEIAVIPHTYENTVLKNLKSGDYVNIEVDVISKYVEKFLSTRDNKTGIDMEFLIKNGF